MFKCVTLLSNRVKWSPGWAAAGLAVFSWQAMIMGVTDLSRFSLQTPPLLTQPCAESRGWGAAVRPYNVWTHPAPTRAEECKRLYLICAASTFWSSLQSTRGTMGEEWQHNDESQRRFSATAHARTSYWDPPPPLNDQVLLITLKHVYCFAKLFHLFIYFDFLICGNPQSAKFSFVVSEEHIYTWQ